MLKKAVFFGILTLSSYALAYSSITGVKPNFNSSSNSKLTLSEALARALSANPEILEKQASLHAARLSVTATRTRLFPAISAEYQYTDSDTPNQELPDANHAFVVLNEDLFNGGRTWAQIHRLRHLEEKAQDLAQEKRLEVMAAVKDSYYEAVSAAEQVNDWTRAESEFSRLLKLMEPKFTVGAVPEYDFVKIRISLRNYKQDKLIAQAKLGHELHLLGEAMGGEPPKTLAEIHQLTPPPDLSVKEILFKSFEARPDVKAQSAQVLAQEDAVTQAKRQRLPKLSLEADYGYGGVTVPQMGIGWGVTALVDLPIFEFGHIRSQVDTEEAKLSAEQERQIALQLKIKTQVYDTLEQVKLSWADYQEALKNLPGAWRAYVSSLRRYRTGLARMAELSDAHSLLVQARLERDSDRALYEMALTKLQLVMGDQKGLERVDVQ